jgi:hypothetical protein
MFVRNVIITNLIKIKTILFDLTYNPINYTRYLMMKKMLKQVLLLHKVSIIDSITGDHYSTNESQFVYFNNVQFLYDFMDYKDFAFKYLTLSHRLAINI